MSAPEVTIILPNYKTPELTKLCVRSLRLYTDMSKIQLIAVDNDSQDASVEYLRTVEFVKLIERKTTGENAPEMHAKALDLALEQVTTPYVMVIHTDTIVVRNDWLDFLLKKISADKNIAAVGSWKLEFVPPLKSFFKRIETAIRRKLGRVILDREHYFRSHCALYKTDCIRQTRGFFDNDSAGISAFNILRDLGYELPFIESEELSRYIRHLNHATMILNPVADGNKHKTSSPAKRRALEKELRQLMSDRIMLDDSLDRL